jgi:CHAD domain-containing protein
LQNQGESDRQGFLHAIMSHMSNIPLSDDQKRILVDLSQTAPEQLVHRARLILAYSEGKPTLRAALDAGISRGRARFWKRQFLLKGMSVFNLALKDHSAVEKQTVEVNIPPKGLQARTTTIETRGDETNILEEIPYPKPLECIGIHPDDTLAEAGRKVWLYFFAEMLRHEEGTLLGENIEELHDMRVATRRMRSAFDIFSPAFEPRIMKRYLKGLRSTGRALGGVRDMDVLLENAINYQRKMKENARPGLEPLLAAWKQTIEKKRSKMIKLLQSEDYHSFKYNFNLFLQTAESNKNPMIKNDGMNTRLRDVVPVLVYSRFAAVRAYDTILITASITQLHALRIEFKKFRYTLEYFKEILGEGANQAISELKQLQDHLGKLHDADVACQLVSRFGKDLDKEQIRMPIPERINPEMVVTYLAYLYAERYRLINSFPEIWKKFSRPEFRQILAQAISLL